MNNAKGQLVYASALVFLCALFLFYKYVMQVFPSVMTDQLMREFKVHGFGLGNLAAAFFYAYMVTQLFVGLMLDRFSPRFLTSLAILIASIGMLVFAAASSIVVATIARLLMGVGAAFATVSYLKFAANWFSAKLFPLIAGLLATAAMLGAVIGEGPLAILVSHVGWREALFICSMAGLILATVFFLIARDANPSSVHILPKQYGQVIHWVDVKAVLKNKNNWYIAMYSGLAFTPVAVFGGLWGNPYLEELFHITRTQAASCVSAAFLGLAFGGPIIGWIASHFGNRLQVMRVCSLISLIALTSVIYWPGLSLSLATVLLFVFGFFSAGFMLGFAIGKEMNPIIVSATVIALINSGEALLGAITEPAVGKILDILWSGVHANGIRYFSVYDYKIAFLLLPTQLLISYVLVFFIRDSESYQGWYAKTVSR